MSHPAGPAGDAQLLSYERELVTELLEDDGLVVTAAGLGWQKIVAVLLRLAQHTAAADEQQHGGGEGASTAGAAQAAGAAGPASAAGAAGAAAGPSTSAAAAAAGGRGSAAASGGGAAGSCGGNGGCVLVLGAQPWQRALIAAEFARHDSSLPAPVDINNEVPALERVHLYRAHGSRPLFVTPRILVVDLLARRLTGRDISGMVLLNAHRVTDTSGEGFAVALYRADNPPGGGQQAGWLRAFSDQPTAFNQGFNKIEKVLKALRVRKLHLMPRFQEYVRQELDNCGTQVEEWEVALSPSMCGIQAAVVEVLDGLIKELRRTNSRIDTSELVLENGLFRAFDEMIRRQLDPIWHTTSWKTRRICVDLRTLRELAGLLTSTDCITFLVHLEGLRQSEGARCVWLFHDATHAMYEQARRRVYIYRAQQPAVAGAAAAPAELEPVLEEPPKWGLLLQALEDVQDKRRRLVRIASNAEASTSGGAAGAGAAGAGAGARAANGGGGGAGRGPAADEVIDLADGDGDEQQQDLDPGETDPDLADLGLDPGALGPEGLARLAAEASCASVLVVARELHSAQLLEKVVRQGCKTVMLALYENYLIGKAQGSGQQPAAATAAGGGGGSGSPQAAGGRGGWRGRGRGGRGYGYRQLASYQEDASRGPALNPGEHKALLAAARRVGEARGATGGAAGRGRGGKGTKRARAIAAAAGGAGGGSEGGRGRGRARGAAAAAAGRGRSSRARKPDDSPLRTAAAAVDEQMDEQDLISDDVDEISVSNDDFAAAPAAVPPPARKASRTAPAAIATGQRGSGKAASALDATATAAAATGGTSASAAQAPAPTGAAAAAQYFGAYGTTADAAGAGAAAVGVGAVQRQGRPDSAATAPATAAAAAPAGPCPLLDNVHFVVLDKHDDFVLWRLRPSFIIMYEPDLAFLRQVELYQAERRAAAASSGAAPPPLWLHTLSYSHSAEQQKFLASVEREREAFTRLIEAKRHIVLPTTLGPQQPQNQLGPRGLSSLDPALDTYSANALTRVAGGRAGGRGAAAPPPRQVVVDVREFMSSLPAVLHQKGFILLPLTLEVGDYVLSPQHVVERKSLADLTASLASGRLFHQADIMCRTYRTPLLLIEFDGDKAFALQGAGELGDDIDPKNIVSKLVLLTTHFPRLRLLWSRSAHATVDIFASLKSNQDEPDAVAAALVGLPQGPDGTPLVGAGGGPGAGLEAVVNQPALELLRRLPGVNDANYRLILGSVTSLAELATLPLERLEAIMGSAKNAKALSEFLNAPCPRL